MIPSKPTWFCLVAVVESEVAALELLVGVVVEAVAHEGLEVELEDGATQTPQPAQDVARKEEEEWR